MTTTLVNLELIADWLKENVCPHLQYKRPNDDNNDGTYNYQLVNPDVHIMYIPRKIFFRKRNMQHLQFLFNMITIKTSRKKEKG